MCTFNIFEIHPNYRSISTLCVERNCSPCAMAGQSSAAAFNTRIKHFNAMQCRVLAYSDRYIQNIYVVKALLRRRCIQTRYTNIGNKIYTIRVPAINMCVIEL